jgi:hypothetical protein
MAGFNRGLPSEIYVITERSSFHRGYEKKELVPLKSAEQTPAGVQPGRSGFNPGRLIISCIFFQLAQGALASSWAHRAFASQPFAFHSNVNISQLYIK